MWYQKYTFADRYSAHRVAFHNVTTTAQFLDVDQGNFNVAEHKARNIALARAKIGKITKAQKDLNVAAKAVETIERTLGIPERWSEECAEYKAVECYMNNRQFVRAIDTLERLVVQRLFELSKANLAGTGVSSHSPERFAH